MPSLTPSHSARFARTWLLGTFSGASDSPSASSEWARIGVDGGGGDPILDGRRRRWPRLLLLADSPGHCAELQLLLLARCQHQGQCGGFGRYCPDHWESLQTHSGKET